MTENNEEQIPQRIREALIEARENQWGVAVLEGAYVPGGCNIRFGPYTNVWKTNPERARTMTSGMIKVQARREIQGSRETLEDLAYETQTSLTQIGQEYMEGPMLTFYEASYEPDASKLRKPRREDPDSDEYLHHVPMM